MSGTYRPAEGVYIGRPPCAECGANWHLHHDRAGAVTCPEAYRPSSIEEAERELRAAEASGNPTREFVARGNLQRLRGRGTGAN